MCTTVGLLLPLWVLLLCRCLTTGPLQQPSYCKHTGGLDERQQAAPDQPLEALQAGLSVYSGPAVLL